MVRKHKCMMCGTSDSSVVLFTLDQVTGRMTAKNRFGLDWKGETPNSCKACAHEKVKKKEGWGFLGGDVSSAYYNASKKKSYADRFIQEGAVMVPADHMPGCYPMIDFMKKICKGIKLDKLETLSDRVEEGKIKHKEDKRRWCNIHGETSRATSLGLKDADHAKLMKYNTTIGIAIEKILFPDIYYGRLAFNTGKEPLNPSENDDEDIVAEAKQRNKNNHTQSVLQCNKINLLARFPGLKHEQHWHRDSDNFGLAAILVLKCCNDSYMFDFFTGSHELSYNGGVEGDLNIVETDKKRLTAKRDHFIFFSPNLVHRGGPSSAASDSNAYSEPSDLSIFFDFSHVGCPTGATPGNGSTLPWKYVPEADPSREFLFKYSGESQKFSGEMSKATLAYLRKLQNPEKGKRESRRHCFLGSYNERALQRKGDSNTEKVTDAPTRKRSKKDGASKGQR